MSTVGLRRSEPANGAIGGEPGGERDRTAPRQVPPARVPLAIRALDLILLALALPVFVVADLPLAGYFAAAAAWIAQRLVQSAVQRRVRAADDPRTVVGLSVGSMIARGWIVAGAVFGVGITAGDEHGLAAAVLVLSLFTIYFATQLATRPFAEESAQ